MAGIEGRQRSEAKQERVSETERMSKRGGSATKGRQKRGNKGGGEMRE